MRSLAIAVLLTACLPGDDELPVRPPSSLPPASSFAVETPDAAPPVDAVDAGAEPTTGTFFDARPPDAAALLPDSL
jgi:hypothetical protein